MWLALFGAARFWDPKELGARLFGPVYQAAHVDGDVARATELLFSALSLQDQLPGGAPPRSTTTARTRPSCCRRYPRFSQYGALEGSVMWWTSGRGGSERVTTVTSLDV